MNTFEAMKNSNHSSKPFSEASNKQDVEPALIINSNQSLTVPIIIQPSGSQGSVTSDDDNGTGRERRARKSVNYAEPKLNTYVMNIIEAVFILRFLI